MKSTLNFSRSSSFSCRFSRFSGDFLFHPLDQEKQLVQVDGFGQVVIGPFFHGRNRRVHGSISGHHHHHGLGIAPLQFRQQRKTVHPRHPEVGQDQVERARGISIQGLGPVLHGDGFVTLFVQKPGQHLPLDFLVVRQSEFEILRFGSFLLLENRENDFKDCSLPPPAAHRDGPAMVLDDLMGQRKAQPDSLFLGGEVIVENPAEILFRESLLPCPKFQFESPGDFGAWRSGAGCLRPPWPEGCSESDSTGPPAVSAGLPEWEAARNPCLPPGRSFPSPPAP